MLHVAARLAVKCAAARANDARSGTDQDGLRRGAFKNRGKLQHPNAVGIFRLGQRVGVGKIRDIPHRLQYKSVRFPQNQVAKLLRRAAGGRAAVVFSEFAAGVFLAVFAE